MPVKLECCGLYSLFCHIFNCKTSSITVNCVMIRSFTHQFGEMGVMETLEIATESKVQTRAVSEGPEPSRSLSPSEVLGLRVELPAEESLP